MNVHDLEQLNVLSVELAQNKTLKARAKTAQYTACDPHRLLHRLRTAKTPKALCRHDMNLGRFIIRNSCTHLHHQIDTNVPFSYCVLQQHLLPILYSGRDINVHLLAANG